MRNAAPWLVVLLAVFAVSPVVRREENTPAEASTSEVKSEETGAPALTREENPAPAAAPGPCRETEKKPAAPWCEPARVVRDYFGLVPAPDSERGDSLQQIANVARSHEMRLMIALVPDPVETQLPMNFDLALDAIQRGFADLDYRFDRFWLPWSGDAAKTKRLYRTAPGVLLFRGRLKNGSPRLAVVLLVGESPKAGIHKTAFRTALHLASGLRKDSDPIVAILGPSLSGSADSLLTALHRWRSDDEPNMKDGASGNGNAAQASNAARRPLEFQIATGSATASGLEKRFEEFSFCRTVVPDEQLWRAGSKFLREQMHWDLRQAALLTEGDTEYGSSVFDYQLRRSPAKRRPKEKDLILLRFQSHVSDVRNAWEQNDKTRRGEEQQVKIRDLQLQTRRPALDLGLGDSGQALDVVPNFSSLTTPAKDLELTNLLETISREGIRYVGVQATDLKDNLYLVERIRESVPGTVVFTFDSNLLFAHPDLGQALDGVVVLTRAPLFTEGANWLPQSVTWRGEQRRQFLAEFQQGIFEAVRYLLNREVSVEPQVWLSVVGNGSLWPMARLDDFTDSAKFCGDRGRKQPQRIYSLGESLAGKSDLQLLLLAGVLCLMSVGLNKVGLLRETRLDRRSRVTRPVDALLMGIGAVLLALLGCVLLVVATLPEWVPLWSDSVSWGSLQGLRIAFLTTLIAVYAYLAVQVVRISREPVNLMRGTVWVLVFAVVPVLLILFAIELWMPGERIVLFHLRARAYSSGLSPLVSFTLLGGSLYVWVLSEIKRKLLVRRRASDCPLGELCEPATAGCGTTLKEIRQWLERILPREKWFWIFGMGIIVSALMLFWQTIQPITEAKNYGRLFLVLVALTAFLAALSFYRFVRLWFGLDRILYRLDHSSPELAKTFQKLSPEFGWKPMKSFGIRMPPFKMLTLSVRKLKSLVASGRVTTAKDPNLLLKEVFEAEATGLSGAEARSRKELEQLFEKACTDLKDQVSVHGAREFLAVRVVAYLRYVFAHLRSCLTGAIGTGLLLLIAVTAYAFEPKQFVSLGIWVTLAVAVAVTLWIFFQMDRNATLSRIGGTKAGEITLDRTFYSNLFLYGLIPVLGMVATQFPSVGRLLGRLADQLLRITGGG